MKTSYALCWLDKLMEEEVFASTMWRFFEQLSLFTHIKRTPYFSLLLFSSTISSVFFVGLLLLMFWLVTINLSFLLYSLIYRSQIYLSICSFFFFRHKNCCCFCKWVPTSLQLPPPLKKKKERMRTVSIETRSWSYFWLTSVRLYCCCFCWYISKTFSARSLAKKK